MWENDKAFYGGSFKGVYSGIHGSMFPGILTLVSPLTHKPRATPYWAAVRSGHKTLVASRALYPWLVLQQGLRATRSLFRPLHVSSIVSSTALMVLLSGSF